MKRYLNFPLVKGEASRQAHADLPDGTYEREMSKEGFFGPAAFFYHRNPPTADGSPAAVCDDDIALAAERLREHIGASLDVVEQRAAEAMRQRALRSRRRAILYASRTTLSSNRRSRSGSRCRR